MTLDECVDEMVGFYISYLDGELQNLPVAEMRDRMAAHTAKLKGLLQNREALACVGFNLITHLTDRITAHYLIRETFDAAKGLTRE